MTFLTFDEWLQVNSDLVDGFIDEQVHCSGVPFRALLEIGAEEAWDMVRDHFRPVYREQRMQDEEKWKAWEALTR